MAEFKRCKEPFAIALDGVARVVPAGAVLSTDDPAYNRGTAAHFEDLETHVTQETAGRDRAVGRVEEASAEPGSRRLLGRFRGEDVPAEDEVAGEAELAVEEPAEAVEVEPAAEEAAQAPRRGRPRKS